MVVDGCGISENRSKFADAFSTLPHLGTSQVLGNNPSSLPKKYCMRVDVSLEYWSKNYFKRAQRHRIRAKWSKFKHIPDGLIPLMSTWGRNLNLTETDITFSLRWRKICKKSKDNMDYVYNKKSLFFVDVNIDNVIFDEVNRRLLQFFQFLQFLFNVCTIIIKTTAG